MAENNIGDSSSDAISETELVALLASLRKEVTPEAHFEERFLYDFHERVAREAVCRPARKLFFEHVFQFLSNFGGRKLVYGASTLGAGAVALGLYTMPSEQAPIKVAAQAASVVGQVENSMASLKPGAAREFTCIAVGQTVESKSFTRDKMSVAQAAPAFAASAPAEEDVLYISSSQPVNMGLSTGMGAAFPSLTTNLAF